LYRLSYQGLHRSTGSVVVVGGGGDGGGGDGGGGMNQYSN
jgi:hypothetical protein